MVLKEYALQYASYMRYEPNTTTEELTEPSSLAPFSYQCNSKEPHL